MQQAQTWTESAAAGSQVGLAGKQLRIPAVDFTKGALVLIMVLYHWLNYFVSAEGEFYKYLRFLTPSFIFISGFVIAHVYFPGSGVRDPQVPGRLFQRGFKLLALFVLLNAARFFLIADSRTGVEGTAPWTVSNLTTIFVSGNVAVNGNIKTTAFNILVPIGYLLILSGCPVIVSRHYKYAFQALCLLCLLAVLMLSLYGMSSGNLELMAIGLLGATVGSVPMGNLKRLVRHRAAVAVAYLCYLAIITLWGMNYVFQIVGVCVNLLVISIVGEANGGRNAAGRHLVLLGKYSLFGYIAQIAILQALHRGVRDVHFGTLALGIMSFIAAFVLTSLSVEFMDRARLRVHVIDRLYKAVFV